MFKVKCDSETLNASGAKTNSAPGYSRSPFSVRPTKPPSCLCFQRLYRQTGFRFHLETHTGSGMIRVFRPEGQMSTLNHLFCSLTKLTQSIVSGPPPQRWLAGACRPLRNGSSLPRLQWVEQHRSYSGNTAYITTFPFLCTVTHLYVFNLAELYNIFGMQHHAVMWLQQGVEFETI